MAGRTPGRGLPDAVFSDGADPSRRPSSCTGHRDHVRNRCGGSGRPRGVHHAHRDQPRPGIRPGHHLPRPRGVGPGRGRGHGAMSPSVQIETSTSGGSMKGLRRSLGGESFFMNTSTAHEADGPSTSTPASSTSSTPATWSDAVQLTRPRPGAPRSRLSAHELTWPGDNFHTARMMTGGHTHATMTSSVRPGR